MAYSIQPKKQKPLVDYRLKPSERKPKTRLTIPPGCSHVWVVRRGSYNSGPPEPPAGIYETEAAAYDHADKLWLAQHNSSGRKFDNRTIFVDHKAGLRFGNKWHFVNITPFQFKGSQDPH